MSILPGYGMPKCFSSLDYLAIDNIKPKVFISVAGNKKFLNVEVPSKDVTEFSFDIFNDKQIFQAVVSCRNSDNPIFTIPYTNNKHYSIKLLVTTNESTLDGEQNGGIPNEYSPFPNDICEKKVIKMYYTQFQENIVPKNIKVKSNPRISNKTNEVSPLVPTTIDSK